MTQQSQVLKYEVSGQIAWITLNRPQVMNAINTQLHRAIDGAFTEINRSEDVLVAVLSGEGGRAFCTGDDLKELSKQDPDNLSSLSYVEEVDGCTKPVIGAVDGYCIGGGFELALRCDILLATEKSLFSLPEPRLGTFAVHALHRLPRVVPIREALWLLLTGDRMSARRAHEIGLVQALLPDREALFTEAKRLAEEIKKGAPALIQAAKRVVRQEYGLTFQSSRDYAETVWDQLQSSQGRLDGARTYTKNRPPKR